MKNFTKLILILFLIRCSTVFAMMPVFDLGAITQLVYQLSELRNQTQMIKLQLAHLDDKSYNWSDAQGLINQLGSVVSQSNGIAYNSANLDEQFKQSYPGYQPPKNFSQQYQNNTAMTLNTLNGVLRSMGTSAQDFQNENTRLQFLQRQSQTSRGQMQAIQASAQIASETVSQLQMLRQTLIAQSNAQDAYYATQIQNEASSRAELGKVVSSGSTVVPAYGTSGHPLNPPE